MHPQRSLSKKDPPILECYLISHASLSNFYLPILISFFLAPDVLLAILMANGEKIKKEFWNYVILSVFCAWKVFFHKGVQEVSFFLMRPQLKQRLRQLAEKLMLSRGDQGKRSRRKPGFRLLLNTIYTTGHVTWNNLLYTTRKRELD